MQTVTGTGFIPSFSRFSFAVVDRHGVTILQHHLMDSYMLREHESFTHGDCPDRIAGVIGVIGVDKICLWRAELQFQNIRNPWACSNVHSNIYIPSLLLFYVPKIRVRHR